MEISGTPHALGTLDPRKQPPVPTVGPRAGIDVVEKRNGKKKGNEERKVK
jgi:hypothetical protein